ncbi:MAG: hypothetical protein IV086_15250 [Hyphomonadaceae bacterium]|nr:MAG: hypothetical protein FD160_2184 [Caulobacteraceae bacterium]MBT9447056.1 hypothetical protein [Hyphomonadaceae bacterium]TPW03804.1 MAG: hypothetical protein FD124_2868 [Alphaproteobacteria bacterium]
MKRALFAVLALSALAACSTYSTGPAGTGAVTPRGGALQSGPIDLGDWRRGPADGVIQRFSSNLIRRYAAGSALSVAVADLRTNQFLCVAPAAGRGGDPPDQVCRRQQVEAGCTHTWQAHLWDDAPGVAAKVSRVRGLYDKRCAADGGLLGGPG